MQSQQSYPYSLPPPIRGWNASEAITSMKSTDAYALDNLFPREQQIDLRKGSLTFATLPSGKIIRSLLPYNAAVGTQKIFAAADDGFYDISAGGTITSAAQTTSTNEWQSVQFTTPGGSYLFTVAGDGTNPAYHYDGSVWAAPAITGVNSNLFTNVTAHKGRLWFIEKNTLNLWYLPIDSIAGAAAKFPLGSFFPKGGKLLSIITWTVDGGSGIDDYFCIITSEGEIAVYEGTDPSSATTWALVGIYNIARPIGKRCAIKIGGDIGILTEIGVIPLSKAIIGSRFREQETTITTRISNAFLSMANSYKTLFGWELQYYPSAPMLLVNIPTFMGVAYQFVMNTNTGAWCRFTDWYADCFGILKDEFYMAKGNIVTQVWHGIDDDGDDIKTLMAQAFSSFGRKNFVKHIPLVKPIFNGSSDFSASLALDEDYNSGIIAENIIDYTTTLAKWDVAKWDQAVWAGDNLIFGDWLTIAHKPGRVFSLRMQTSTNSVEFSYLTSEMICQRGGMF